MSPEEELLPNVSSLTPFLVGDVGLICTDSSPSDILQFFSDYVQTDFARAGTSAPRSFTIPEGVVYSRGGEIPAEEDVPLPHDLEARVRGFGMPTKLVKGKVMLDGDYEVCREGQVMNSHQTSLLKTFGVTMAEFKVQIKAYDHIPSLFHSSICD